MIKGLKDDRIQLLEDNVKKIAGFANLLRTVADGCLKHPSYRAVRKPTASEPNPKPSITCGIQKPIP